MDIIDALSEERIARRKAEQGVAVLNAITQILVTEARKQEIAVTQNMSVRDLLVAVLAKLTGETNGEPRKRGRTRLDKPVFEAMEAKDG